MPERKVHCISWKNVSRRPSEILVIQWARLGDLFHSRPLCEAAQRVFHPATITLCCDERYVDVAKSFPEVDRVLPINLGVLISMLRSDATLADALDSVRVFFDHTHYDAIINLTNHKAAQFFAERVDAEQRFGYGMPEQRALREFETRVLSGDTPDHIANAWRKIIEPGGELHPPVSLMCPGTPKDENHAVVICDAGDPNRSLTSETIDAICCALSKSYISRVTLAGVTPRPFSPSVDIRVEDVRGKTTLTDLRHSLVTSHVVIGPDTGALHYAAALGKQVVGVYLAGARSGTTGQISLRARCIESRQQDAEFRDNLEVLICDAFSSQESSRMISEQCERESLSILITEHGHTHYADTLISQLRDTSMFCETEVIVLSGGLNAADAQLASHRDGVITDIASGSRSFAEACNHGAMLARGRWLLILNDDCEIRPESLLTLLNTRERGKIVGPRLRHWDGLIQSVGFQCDGDTVSENGSGEWMHHSATMHGVSAAAMLVERDLFQQLGGFDSDFHNGYEDVDFCLRAARHGVDFKLAECDILHFGGSSPERFEKDDRNLALLTSRWKSHEVKNSSIVYSNTRPTPIVILSEESSQGAGAVLRWRESLRSVGLAEGTGFQWLSTRDSSPEECIDLIDHAEQIVVYRAISNARVQKQVIEWANQKRGRLIYDCDDIILNRFADGSARAKNRRFYESAIRELILHADVCVGSTDPVLSQYRGAHCPLLQIETLPSVMHFAERYIQQEHTTFSIGYAGGAVHQTDFALAAPALMELLESDESVRFYWWGAHPGELASHPQVRRGGAWIDRYERHVERIQRAPIDLWLVPLAESPHNAARSPLKAFEYIGMNSPCMFSNVDPFKSLLAEVSSALLVNNESQAWSAGIERWRDQTTRESQLQALNAARLNLFSQTGKYRKYADLFVHDNQVHGRGHGQREANVMLT